MARIAPMVEWEVWRESGLTSAVPACRHFAEPLRIRHVPQELCIRDWFFEMRIGR